MKMLILNKKGGRVETDTTTHVILEIPERYTWKDYEVPEMFFVMHSKLLDENNKVSPVVSTSVSTTVNGVPLVPSGKIS